MASSDILLRRKNFGIRLLSLKRFLPLMSLVFMGLFGGVSISGWVGKVVPKLNTLFLFTWITWGDETLDCNEPSSLEISEISDITEEDRGLGAACFLYSSSRVSQ